MSRYAITTELAKQMVADIKAVSDANANVIGEGGVIIASADPKRVGTVHEGGKRILEGETDEIAITSAMAESMNGVKPGYNCVVKLDKQRIGVIGISGEPDLVRPIAKMAAIIVREEARREIEMNEKVAFIRNTEIKIKDIAELMKVLTLNGAIQASKLGSAGKPFKVVVEELQKLAEQINQVVGKIHVDK